MTYNTAINEPRIREMVASIARDPNSWNMRHWAKKTDCGTTYCAAGHVMNSAGLKMIFSPIDGAALGILEDDRYIQTVASELLGLNRDQSYKIFYAAHFCDHCDIMIEAGDADYNYDEEYDYHVECGTDVRHPTIREFADKVTEVTGIVFKDEDLV